MKHTKIRHSVFETNSSSTHSICICDKDVELDKLPIDRDGVCRVFGGEFGWEEETHYSPITKASYCLTYAKTLPQSSYSGDDKPKLITISDSFCQMLKEVIEDYMKAPVEFCTFDGESEDYKWGYIDHQSHFGESNACGEAFLNKESLKKFIFNPLSYLVTDNDNH